MMTFMCQSMYQKYIFLFLGWGAVAPWAAPSPRQAESGLGFMGRAYLVKIKPVQIQQQIVLVG